MIKKESKKKIIYIQQQFFFLVLLLVAFYFYEFLFFNVRLIDLEIGCYIIDSSLFMVLNNYDFFFKSNSFIF